MPYQFVTGTISAGNSLSAGIDCSAGELSSILLPVGWTNANISLQASPDNIVPYGDMYDWDGREVIIAAAPGRMIIINPFASEGSKGGVAGMFFKIRSGSATFPVMQAADRTFTLGLKTP